MINLRKIVGVGHFRIGSLLELTIYQSAVVDEGVFDEQGNIISLPGFRTAENLAGDKCRKVCGYIQKVDVNEKVVVLNTSDKIHSPFGDYFVQQEAIRAYREF